MGLTELKDGADQCLLYNHGSCPHSNVLAGSVYIRKLLVEGVTPCTRPPGACGVLPCPTC